MSGIIACGLVYALIGAIVVFAGTNWIEKMMPPVVTGAIVMIIGLNLAPATVGSVAKTLVAALIAIALGLSPKFGAVISIIPAGIIGGASIVVFGLITVAGAKIWINNQVDFNNNKNLLIAAATLILGTGNFALHIGTFDLGGIGTATFAAILLNAFFNLKKEVN